ncbi:MAG: hypothetical protein ACHQEA_09640 [Gaiellales bacterium]
MALFRRRSPEEQAEHEARKQAKRDSRHGMWEAMKLQRAIAKAENQRARGEPVTALPPDVAERLPVFIVNFTQEDGSIGFLAVSESELTITTDASTDKPSFERVPLGDVTSVTGDIGRLDLIIDGRMRTFHRVDPEDRVPLIVVHIVARR